jgi:hypothetical protein
MRYIERVVWKSLDWYTGSPEPRSDGARPKPNGLVVDLCDGRMLMASAPFKGSCVTIGVTGGLRISIPAEKAEEVAEAILYAHRCVSEHDYEARNRIVPSTDAREERGAGSAPS